MPDADDTQSELTVEFETARIAVSTRLDNFGASFKVLTAKELEAYPKRDFVAGYRLAVQFSGHHRHIDLLLPVGFPWQAPRIALVDRPPFLVWPHVERDGILCLDSEMLGIDSDDPSGVAICLLNDAVELIEQLIAENLNGDFQDEVLSYWDHTTDSSSLSFISLLQVEPPTREVCVWRSKKFYVLAENKEEMERWLFNRFGEKPGGYRTESAAFLWLDAPPLPNNYPQTGKDLRILAESIDIKATTLLTNLTRTRPDELIAALCFSTVNGPAIVGVVSPIPTASQYGARVPLLNGFRDGAIPDSLMLTRYLGGSTLTRHSVERADPDWIHGRGQDLQAMQLREKTVAIVGCGSVGAAVATMLAQAGVGNLVLIDSDTLKWPNIGRHSLGASYINQYKSKALAEKLRSDFPHITVTHYEHDIDTIIRQYDNTLSHCHLVVSATGSWAADSRLDAWQEAVSRKVPIVYGWLEAHACAGHAVLIQDINGSFRFGFDKTGLPHFHVTAWPSGTPLRSEPACGAIFQPYGPVELSFANGLIASLALDLLLNRVIGNVHKVWIGPRKQLIESKGTWSKEWKADKDFHENGGFILERSWPTATRAHLESIQAA